MRKTISVWLHCAPDYYYYYFEFDSLLLLHIYWNFYIHHKHNLMFHQNNSVTNEAGYFSDHSNRISFHFGCSLKIRDNYFKKVDKNTKLSFLEFIELIFIELTSK